MKTKFFKNLSMIVFTIACSMFSAGCGCQQVGIGEVGVKTRQFGSQKGIDTKPYTTGAYLLGFGEGMAVLPITKKQYVFTQSVEEESSTDEAIYFNDQNGLKLNCDMALEAFIEPSEAPAIYGKYKLPLKDIIKSFGKSILRDCVMKNSSVRTVDEIYGAGNQEFMKDVERDVIEAFAKDRITILSVYQTSDVRMPEQVKEALNAKMAAIQKADQIRNEVAQKVAEADKLEAEARGQKAKQELEAQGLTEELLRKMWIDRWNGVAPSTVVVLGDASALKNFFPTK